MEREKRTAEVKTIRETRKRKEPVADIDIQRGSFSANNENVSNISDENYQARNEQLWKYYFDNDNFKCAKTDK